MANPEKSLIIGLCLLIFRAIDIQQNPSRRQCYHASAPPPRERRPPRMSERQNYEAFYCSCHPSSLELQFCLYYTATPLKNTPPKAAGVYPFFSYRRSMLCLPRICGQYRPNRTPGTKSGVGACVRPARLLASTSLCSCARLRLRGFPSKQSFFGAFGVPRNTSRPLQATLALKVCLRTWKEAEE